MTPEHLKLKELAEDIGPGDWHVLDYRKAQAVLSLLKDLEKAEQERDGANAKADNAQEMLAASERVREHLQAELLKEFARANASDAVAAVLREALKPFAKIAPWVTDGMTKREKAALDPETHLVSGGVTLAQCYQVERAPTSLPAAAKALLDRVAELEDAVRKSAERFREYERLHAAKPDLVKAARNGEMAAMCEHAIRPLKEQLDPQQGKEA